MTPCSLLPKFGMGSEQTAHLADILGEPDIFSNPKPVEMIKLFVEWFCPKDGYVLDFFAGSGTTLESTMTLNMVICFPFLNSKRKQLQACKKRVSRHSFNIMP